MHSYITYFDYLQLPFVLSDDVIALTFTSSLSLAPLDWPSLSHYPLLLLHLQPRIQPKPEAAAAAAAPTSREREPLRPMDAQTWIT